MQKNIEPAEQKFRRLWLVRHGATLWNSEQRFCGHSDIPLSSEGQAQAGWLADYLQDTTYLDNIYQRPAPCPTNSGDDCCTIYTD